MRSLILKIDDKVGITAFFSYVVIGFLSVGINFLTFALCWDFFQIHYSIAVTIAYGLTIIFNFSCNRYFTFKSHGSNLTRHLYRYLTMIFLNYAITLFIVHVVIKFSHLSPYLGLLASIFVTTLIGFSLSRFWIYKK